MHFCEFAARFHLAMSLLGSTVPRKIGLNCNEYELIEHEQSHQQTWFMPALAKSRVGSSWGMVADEGTNVCSFFSEKKEMNFERTSAPVGTLPA